MGFKLRLLQKEEMELWRVGVVLGRAEGKEGRGAGKDSWLSCSFLLQRPLGDTGALRWVVSRSIIKAGWFLAGRLGTAGVYLGQAGVNFNILQTTKGIGFLDF